MMQVYSFCEKKQIPIVFHCRKAEGFVKNEKGYCDIDNFVEILNKFPKLTVVLAHMGGGKLEKTEQMAVKYKNLYFDTAILLSGSPELKTVKGWINDEDAVKFINKIGADRIIFGSDSPWGTPDDDIKRIKNLPISDEAKRLILGRNAVRVFKLR